MPRFKGSPDASPRAESPLMTPAERKRLELNEAYKKEREANKPIPIADIIPIKGDEGLSYEQFLKRAQTKGKFKLAIELPPDKLVNDGSLIELIGGDMQGKILQYLIRTKGNVCKVCGHIGAVYLHDVWNYGHETRPSEENSNGERDATLKGLQLLCERCYQAKHLGLDMPKDVQKRVFTHFVKVNECAPMRAADYIQGHIILRAHRSKFEWTQNFDILTPILNAIQKGQI